MNRVKNFKEFKFDLLKFFQVRSEFYIFRTRAKYSKGFIEFNFEYV